MSSLSAHGVTFGYGGDDLLKDISFEARPGEVTAVIGPNGAGKTTLLKLLAGRLTPSTGDIRLDASPLTGRSRRWIARRIAMSPQFETPTWQLTVAQAVQLGRAPHRGWILPMKAEDQDAVDLALQEMDLTDLAERSVTQLSGGELRRVLFARILAQGSRVVLLDEPTAHLDLKHQEEVSRHFRSLAREQGVTVIVTLHDLNQTAAYADRVVLLHQGKVLALGSPEEVFTAECIREAYGVEVDIARHPGSGRLWISPFADRKD